MVRVTVVNMATIEELQQDKKELATAIYNLLKAFTENYGVIPTIVVVTYINMDDILEDKIDLVDVRVEVTL